VLRKTQNVNKVSIEDIAKYARVSPTTIYNNFSTKHNLMSEVIKQMNHSHYQIYAEIFNSDVTFMQKLRLIMEKKNELGKEMDWDNIIKMFSDDPEMSAYAGNYYNNIIKPMLIKLIDEGKQQGAIDKNLSNEAITIYLDIINKGAELYFHHVRTLQRNTYVLRQLNHIFFYGFLKENQESGYFEETNNDKK
jgi:AcrR family transcriptional regulator